jgi:hypothetical protein
MVDRINRDSNAGGFIELTEGRIENGNFVDVRCMGPLLCVVCDIERKPLKNRRVGNYNVPQSELKCL